MTAGWSVSRPTGGVDDYRRAGARLSVWIQSFGNLVYRFLEAIAWIILLQLGLLWLSTSVVFISPGEQGLIERFGNPLGGSSVLEPGLHVKLPWPIDTVLRARTREIQSFNVGFELEEEKEKETTVL